MMNLRENLNKRVAPPSPKRRSTSNSRKALLDALAAQERLAKAGESSYRAANVLGLHFDSRASKRAQLNYDNAAASRAGVNIHDQEGCFHILSYTPFTQRGICFPTVHHYVMAERFKGSPIEGEFPAAASLWEIDRLCEIGEQNGWERPDWPQVRLNTLIIGTFLKFRQNPDALKILTRTKQRPITQENLPAHYSKWIAHEKVEKKKNDEDENKDDYYSSRSRSSARARAKSASEFLTEKVQKENGPDEKTVITGSSHKNLGGAILMSLRKKLILAHQADEKARIKKRQMEILAQQMEEAKKKEEEAAAKAAAKAAAAEKKGSTGNTTTRTKSSTSTARRTASTTIRKSNSTTTTVGGKSSSKIASAAAAGGTTVNNTKKQEDQSITKETNNKSAVENNDVHEASTSTQLPSSAAVPDASSQNHNNEEVDDIAKDVLESVGGATTATAADGEGDKN